MRVLLIAALAASPAIAQTTDCRNYLGGVRCETSQSTADRQRVLLDSTNPPSDPNSEAYRDAVRLEQQRQWLRERVGGLIAKGRCDEARSAALKGGDFDLAERVPVLCR